MIVVSSRQVHKTKQEMFCSFWVSTAISETFLFLDDEPQELQESRIGVI